MKPRVRPGVRGSGRLRQAGTASFSVKNVSITTKLALIIGSLVAVSVGVLLVVAVAFHISTGVRAYIAGESLYSKGQKDAVYYLVRYIHTHSEQDYQGYLKSLSIPLGDHTARIELEKPVFDYDTAVRGFQQGGNDPEDIPYLISLYRDFRHQPYMAPALEAWKAADGQVKGLQKYADELHQVVLAGGLSRERAAESLQRIDRINTVSGEMQREFSDELGKTARQAKRLLMLAIALTAAVLLMGAFWLSWALSREFRISIFNLRNAALRVTKGDFDHRVEVRSRDELGDLTGVFNTMIEQRMEAEQELRSAKEFRDKVMHSVSNAIYVIDQEGRFVLVNRRVCTMTGYAESELVGMLFDKLIPRERLADVRGIFEGIVRDGVPVENYETTLVRKDKQVIMISFSSAPFFKDQLIVGVVGAAEDVTEKRLYDAHIARLANYDALTDLPNRNLLNDRIAQTIAWASRHGTAVAVIFIDVDGFKFINDSFGHVIGDELLKRVAIKIGSCVSPEDTVARLGGDEFVILLSNFEEEFEVINTANRILQAIAHPFVIDAHSVHVTASIGISFHPDDGQSSETLLKYADIAMYRAKEAGRNCVKCFTSDMAVNAIERVELEVALREALEHSDFVLHYQPQFDLKSGSICSAEALMRWHHSTLGMISPARFIPLAEEIGLIVPIGEWVLRTACQELKVWHQLGHTNLSVAVNISSRQFQRQGMVQLVRDVLAETGLPPACLHLEITESVILQGSEGVIEMLKELKAMGVILALDDFGTGYSSLAYLKRFPIDILKIDQSFVLDLMVNPEAASIIRAILAMAHSLNLKTIAEGVETREQMNFLASHGCDAIQGFFKSQALSAAEFKKRLTEWQQPTLKSGSSRSELAS